MERRAGAYSRSLSYQTNAEVCTYHDHLYTASLLFIRVTSTVFSGDARFVLTGSDDGNVRIWKAKASDKLGVITARERAAMEYRESLKNRWKVDSEVSRVTR